MILYDLLKTSKNIDEKFYEYIELLNSICMRYVTTQQYPDNPFPFNYLIRHHDLIENDNIIKVISDMKKIGLDTNNISISDAALGYINGCFVTSTEQIDNYKIIQSLLRMCYRLYSELIDKNIKPIGGDSKSIKLSKYIQAIFDILDIKTDIGTFIEKLYLLKEDSKQYDYILYDYKDIPQGYNDCLHKSCMNNSNSSVHEAVNFYTWFKNIRLLCIKQSDKIVSRAILWQLSNKNWLCDRIYSYNNCVDMYEDIKNKLGAEFTVHNYSKDTDENIIIEDMRIGKSEAEFLGFVKNKDKMYVSVQEIDTPYPNKTSPFFDSVRTIKINKKYCKKIVFIFNRTAIKNMNKNKCISIRGSSTDFIKNWAIYKNNDYLYDINKIIYINGIAFDKDNLALFINRDYSISTEINSISDYSIIGSSNSLSGKRNYIDKISDEYLQNIEITDFYNNNIENSLFTIQLYADNNITIYVSEIGYILRKDAVFRYVKNSHILPLDIYTKLHTGNSFYVNLDIRKEDDCILSRFQYKTIGTYRDIPISTDISNTVLCGDTQERILLSDSIEVNGKYYLKDLSLGGISND